MGTPFAAVPTLERLLKDGHEVVAVYTQPDRPAGRGNHLTSPPVKDFAAQHALDVLQPAKIRTEDALATFKSFGADVAVVVAYGRILPEPFLSAFPMRAINVHFSLLPKYRGAAPVNWAIVNGETTTGVTTMQMDVGLDTGNILLQLERPIGSEETAVELMARLSIDGAELLSETLFRYHEIVPQPQCDGDASFAPILRKEDGLMNWELGSRQIANRVRGFQPFPGVFTFYRGARLMIRKAMPVGDGHHSKSPGEIIGAKVDELTIACGGGTILRIEELQLEGKRSMTVRDFINGIKPVSGERFESNAR